LITDIVFDFGNVLYQLDIDGCHNRLASLCGLDKDEFLKRMHPIIARYEKGEIGDENFIWHLQQFNQTLNPREFVEAWNSMLIGIDKKIPQFLSQLSVRYNIYLLSNINGLHARHVDRYLQRVLQEPQFLTQHFKQYFYSHIIHLRKPDAETYAYVSGKISARHHSSVLFIDDNRENIKAAIQYGWRGQWHHPKDDIIDCIEKYLSNH